MNGSCIYKLNACSRARRNNPPVVQKAKAAARSEGVTNELGHQYHGPGPVNRHLEAHKVLIKYSILLTTTSIVNCGYKPDVRM